MLVALLYAAFACKDEKTAPLPDPSVTVAEADKSVTFTNEAGERTVVVSANREVWAAASETWCTPATTLNADKSVNLLIAVSKNETSAKRTATVTGSSSHPVDFADNTYFGLYHRPSVMYDADANCWKMWFDYASEYHASSGFVRLSMGYAENRGDPMKFADWQVLRTGADPALAEFANPDVLKINGKYYAYADPNARYHGAQSEHFGSSGWPVRQCVEAQSDDGVHWRVTGFLDPDEDTQANHVPTLYYEDGVLFLFYAAQKGNRSDDGFKTLGNKYYNATSYDYRYFAIRFKARFLDVQMANHVTY
ncbi:MAG: hypothetical protein LBR08_07135 [Bacteroidales bacterium]|jgi:hypothetical protein|nr:hypothetical protein [Bacteroidales bacterium]